MKHPTAQASLSMPMSKMLRQSSTHRPKISLQSSGAESVCCDAAPTSAKMNAVERTKRFMRASCGGNGMRGGWLSSSPRTLFAGERSIHGDEGRPLTAGTVNRSLLGRVVGCGKHGVCGNCHARGKEYTTRDFICQGKNRSPSEKFRRPLFAPPTGALGHHGMCSLGDVDSVVSWLLLQKRGSHFTSKYSESLFVDTERPLDTVFFDGVSTHRFLLLPDVCFPCILTPESVFPQRQSISGVIRSARPLLTSCSHITSSRTTGSSSI